MYIYNLLSIGYHYLILCRGHWGLELLDTSLWHSIADGRTALARNWQELLYRLLSNVAFISRFEGPMAFCQNSDKICTWSLDSSILRPPRGSVKLISTKVVNLVLLEQCHHNPMSMYVGGVLMLALGGKWASSPPLEQHPSTPRKILGQTFVPLNIFDFHFTLRISSSGLFLSPPVLMHGGLICIASCLSVCTKKD